MSVHRSIECFKYNCITTLHLSIPDLDPKSSHLSGALTSWFYRSQNHTQIVYCIKFQFLCDKVGT